MSWIRWPQVNQLSCLLEADERNVVLGDLVEAHASAGQAFWSVLGLVARRQAALWKDWRPWLVLAAIGPIGLQLSRMSLSLSALAEMNLRTYWTYGVRYGDGLNTIEEIVMAASAGLVLLVCSWMSGFALVTLSRRTVWISLLLYFGTCIYPFVSVFYFVIRSRPVSHHPLAFSRLLVMLTLAALVRTGFFLVPFLAGALRALRGRALTLPQTSILAAAIVGLTVLTTWTGGFSGAAVVRWSGGVWNASSGWQDRFVPLAVTSSPVIYLLAVAISRRQAKTS